MSQYLTDEDLEARALAFRRGLGLEGQPHIDLMTVIQKLKGEGSGFNYLRVPDDQMRDAEGQWDGSERLVKLRESTFRGMQAQHPHDRMTVAHELSHCLLNHKGVRNRSISQTAAEKFASDVRREESEAKRLAPRLLAPAYLIASEDTVADISSRFGISLESAGIRRDEVDKLQRKSTGQSRPLPPNVIDYLREAKRRGQTVTVNIEE